MRAIDADEYMGLLKEQYLHNTIIRDAKAARAWQGAMQLLYDQPTLPQPSNEPLTLEELRGMDGEPVWVVVSENWRESGIKSGWRLVSFHINDDRVRLYMFDTRFGASFFAEQDMGRSYWVYRRPPEGETDA